MKKPQIYPIDLSPYLAQQLVKNHAAQEFRDGTRYHHNAEYHFGATLLASGDVEVFVGYHDDNGFCFSSGPVLRKTLRPFGVERIKEFEEKKKHELAEKEYQRRVQAEILKIQEEMFNENR